MQRRIYGLKIPPGRTIWQFVSYSRKYYYRWKISKKCNWKIMRKIQQTQISNALRQRMQFMASYRFRHNVCVFPKDKIEFWWPLRNWINFLKRFWSCTSSYYLSFLVFVVSSNRSLSAGYFARCVIWNRDFLLFRTDKRSKNYWIYIFVI